MKPRLIDANELIQTLCETFCGQNPCSVLCETIKAIEDQPTAYDVTSVVEQLEGTFDNWGLDDGKKDIMRELVKGGGKHDD